MMVWKLPTLIVLVTFFRVVSHTGTCAADHSPNQFEHHPDVKIELFAAEPDVVDPVCVTFTANGDCFVVEMRDYPYGFGDQREPGGTIRLLRDSDRDGRADESYVFAEGLSFPTSVLAYRDGVLILAPPQILFLKDSDGDNKADIHEVILDGLELGVTDSNANSLRWGVDGLIHVANGGNGGTVWLASKPDKRVRLGDWDFAIDLDKQQIFKTGATGGGFGLVFDAAGNSFTTYNIDYLQQRVIPHEVIVDNPAMYPFDATENISDHGASARIYPVVQAETRVNHPEQAGHFSSAGGMGLLESGPLHEKLGTSIFVCDVVCNLVHRDLLHPDGAAFRAARAPEELDREFIASHDPACRPIGLEHGPDGALYLLDMQRDVIEHPDYIPERVLEKMDVRAGDDRGRIYRIVPREGLSTKFEQIDQSNNRRLVELLSSNSQWQAESAHRLLMDRNSSDVVRLVLDEMHSDTAISDMTPSGIVRAMWVLHRLDRLDQSVTNRLLQHESSIVRQTAVKLSTDKSKCVQKLTDRDAAVRFQALLSIVRHRERVAAQISAASDPQSVGSFHDVLLRDRHDKWMRRAVLLAVGQDADLLLQAVWSDLSGKETLEPIDETLVAELANVTAAGLPKARRDSFLDWLADRKLDESGVLMPSLISGLNAGWKRRPSHKPSPAAIETVINRWIGRADFDQNDAIIVELLEILTTFDLDLPVEMAGMMDDGLGMIVDSSIPVEKRIRSIEIASRAAMLTDNHHAIFSTLVAALETPSTAELHQAAVAGLARLRDPTTTKVFCEHWTTIMPSIRPQLINVMLSRREYHDDLLTALENGTVQFSELNLDLEQRRTLLRWSSDDIGRRAAKLFGDEEYSNRKAIVDEWLAKLPEAGDSNHGRQVYDRKCSICHVSDGRGSRVGPDMQALSHRSVEDLLTHILDPNMSINPHYVSCVVETVDGQIVNGLLKQETKESVTLMQAEGKQTTVPRSDIESLRTLPTSLMPEGLEKELSPHDLRSLISYLQGGR